MTSTQIRFPGKLYDKIKTIAKSQTRSINGQIIHIVEQYIIDYEKINGKIIVEDAE